LSEVDDLLGETGGKCHIMCDQLEREEKREEERAII